MDAALHAHKQNPFPYDRKQDNDRICYSDSITVLSFACLLFL